MTKKMLAEGGYDFGGSRLQNVANGVSSSDVVTKAQMDAALSAAVSNLDYKGSVRVASTANVAIASAPATIDSVSLVANDRILLKDQTSGLENGIYVFTAAGSALTRATDADTTAEVSPGLWVTVEEGSANADTAWLLTTNGPVTVDTTPLEFSKYPAAVGGGGGSVNKYAATGPTSAGATWTVTHSLGTDDVVVSVRDVSTKEEVDVAIVHTDASTVTLKAAATLTVNGYRVVVLG